VVVIKKNGYYDVGRSQLVQGRKRNLLIISVRVNISINTLTYRDVVLWQKVAVKFTFICV
jgi:hypothetical protein